MAAQFIDRILLKQKNWAATMRPKPREETPKTYYEDIKTYYEDIGSQSRKRAAIS